MKEPTKRSWGRRSSVPAADPDARPKVVLPPRSKSDDALGYDEEMNARPPLVPPELEAGVPLERRSSAYFDALQQLDEQEYEQEGARRYAQPEPPQSGYVSRLWSIVRGTSLGARASGEYPTTSPNAKRRATVSGEHRRRAAESGECAPAVSALVLHRTSSDERLEISTEGGERPKAGPESNRSNRGKTPSGDGPKGGAFAFMDAPEPFVQVNSTAHLSSSLLEATFLMLLGVLTALLAVLIVQVPIAINQLSGRAQAAALECFAPYGYHRAARLAAYLAYLGISLLCGALALAVTLPPLGSRHAVGSGIPEMKASYTYYAYYGYAYYGYTY